VNQTIVEALSVARVLTHTPCPCCGRELNAAVDVEVGALCEPHAGDLTICIACNAILEFGPELELAPAKLEQLDEIDRVRLTEAIEDLTQARRAVERQSGEL
jgi:hypothetical protein